MDIHSDSTSTPSAHLSSVQELLEKLDEMKTGRVAARQRLDFLLRHGSEVIQDFDFRDAFDLEMQAMGERLKKIGDMGTNLRAFKGSWTSGPLEEDVQKAGVRLVDHLDEFVTQASRKETITEIDMLSQLWISDPDVSAVFGLPLAHYTKPGTEWGAGETKYAAARGGQVGRPGDGEAEKLESVRDELEEEVANENVKEMEMPSADDQVKEMKKLFPELKDQDFKTLEKAHNAFIEGLAKKAEEAHQQVLKDPTANLERQKEISKELKDPEVRAHLAGAFNPKVAARPVLSDDHQVVGQVSKTSSTQPAPSKSVHREELPAEIDELNIRTWTRAINETLVSKWKFDRQLRGRVGEQGRMGITLIWKKGKAELRLDLESLALDETLVRLVPPRATDRWPTEDEERMYQVHAQEMSNSALEELHQDPNDFVKSILV